MAQKTQEFTKYIEQTEKSIKTRYKQHMLKND